MLRCCCFSSSGVFCNPSVPVALGNLCSSESPFPEGHAEGSLAPAARGNSATQNHIPVETGEKEGFNIRFQRIAVFFLRKTSFAGIPWCLGRGGTGKSRQGMLPAAVWALGNLHRTSSQFSFQSGWM